MLNADRYNFGPLTQAFILYRQWLYPVRRLGAMNAILQIIIYGGCGWFTIPSGFAQNTYIGANTFVASESEKAASFSIHRYAFFGHEDELKLPASYKFSTTDNTAKSGIDYVATNGVVSFAPGEVERQFQVALIDNSRVDGERTFHVNFDELASDATSTGSDVMVTIWDDEVNGSVDPDFRPAVMLTECRSSGRFFVAPVPTARPRDEGKIWVSGGPNGVARLNADGSLDTGFSLDDRLALTTPSPDLMHSVEPLLALRDGSLLVLEYFVARFASSNRLVHVLEGGQMDTNFAPSVNVRLAVEQDQGMVILAAQDREEACGSILFRIGRDGLPDAGFMTAHIRHVECCEEFTRIRALRVDSHRRVLAMGKFLDAWDNEMNPVIRLQPDGSVDPTFQPNLHVNGADTPFHAVSDLIVDRLDRVWLLGDFQPHLVRLKPDGEADPDFAGFTRGDAMLPDGEGVLLLAPMGTSRRTLAGQVVLEGVLEVKADGSVNQVTAGQGQFPFAWRGLGETRNDIQDALALDAAGHILVASLAVVSQSGPVLYPGLVRMDRGAAQRKQFQLNYPTLNGDGDWWPYGFNEFDNPIARIRIFRTGDTGEAAGVDFATVDDTARAGRDYVATTGRVEFAPMEVEREIQVPLLDNAVVDGDRQFRIALRQPSAGYRVPALHAPFTIWDDEFGFPPGAVRRLADGRVRLTLSNPADGQNYSLQASADLQHWTPLATNSACCGRPLTLTFEDTNAPAAQRFYRAIPSW